MTRSRVCNHCSLQHESTNEKTEKVNLAPLGEPVGPASVAEVAALSLEELVDQFSSGAAVLSRVLSEELAGLALPRSFQALAFFATLASAFLKVPLDSHQRLCHQALAHPAEVDQKRPSWARGDQAVVDQKLPSWARGDQAEGDQQLPSWARVDPAEGDQQRPS
eukprot:COSAG02_NODE_10355_length_1961_cov_1.676692_2_plen_164_part_00